MARNEDGLIKAKELISALQRISGKTHLFVGPMKN
jgi:hypothetical protein